MPAMLALLLVAGAFAGTASALLQPANLSVDYWSPADVAATKLAWVDPAASRGVRFSWQLTTAGATSSRGAAQAAYQLQVSEDETAFWDSGVVKSNRTLHIKCEKPLAADTRYRWRVEVTGVTGGASEFSPWQPIATALSPAEWDASGSVWINGGDEGNQLRAQFAVPAEHHAAMAHASLFYSGTGYGLAWLNGVNVAPEEALGPWTTWQQRILYRSKDVTATLKPGENVRSQAIYCCS